MNATQPGRIMLMLLVVPGAGFIFLFLSAAIAMTFLQSIGLYSLVGESRLTADYWFSLLDKGFFDSFLFSLKVGVGSAFGTLLFAYPLALFLRRKRFGSRTIGSIIKIPLFVPALVAAFLILNVLAFNGILNSALMGLGLIDRPLRMLNDTFGWNVLVIQVWKNLPFQLLIIASVLETIQTDIEDAARNLGASPMRVIFHIILPMSAPGILIAVVLVFILTFGDYAITRVAGPVYPSSLSVLMYTDAFTLQQWGIAACIGMVIIVASLGFVAIYARAARVIEEMGR
ncbi:MAG: spermidine/putrescine ABC transporter permease [Rhodospirillum sp.]|jgi:putative spermidine/putrescine transport system permease protein|nr:spermidine/putrescine ABC transporter permease [Rhodospirillum sp.]